MTHTERPESTPITSPRSDRVRQIASLSGRSARRRTGLLRAEGPQAVRSLVDARPDLAREVFATDTAAAAYPEILDAARAAGIRVRGVTDEVLAAMVRGGDATARDGEPAGQQDVVSPQGILAVSARPEADWGSALAALPADGPVTVAVMAETQDPGNAGTIIRTADAAGADLVVLGAGSTDPFAPKAVRSSAGSVFHLPVATGADLAALLPALAERGITAAATSGHADADLFATDLPPRIAWILGNEARGLPEAVLADAPLAVRIPLEGRAESLNVAIAATLCLFESLRRRGTAA
ncbi:TrmH family RNA methyltransferase [Brachybacterium huguangmaarense]